MKRQQAYNDFLISGGTMGGLIDTKDWKNHPLGPIETWPQSLKSALSICLHSKFPMSIYWGRDMYLLYNDAWSSILGDKHPESLGKKASEVWEDIWNLVEPAMKSVFENGTGSIFKEQLLPMRRHGYTEETYFNYTFSPIFGENMQIAGIFNVSNDITAPLLAERRNSTLRKLSEHSLTVESPEAAAILATNILSETPSDVSFALIYLLSDDKTNLRLTASTELELSSTIAPELIKITQQHILKFNEVIATKKSLTIRNLSPAYNLPGGQWDRPTRNVVVIPIIRPHTKELYGVFVGGISPRLSYDNSYANYYSHIAELIAMSVGNAYDLRRKLKLEARERQAQEQLQTALSTGSIGIWIWDIKQNIVIADKNLAYRFGVDENDAASGLPMSVFTESIHPDDRTRVLQDIQDSITTTKMFEAEYRTITRDGAVKWVIARGKVEDDAAGNPTRFPGVIVDITDRKEVERELASSERMFNALFESSIMAVAVVTLDGKVHEANETFLSMFGYNHQDLENGFYSHMITPSKSKGVTSIIYQQLRDKGQAEPIEKDYVHKDGTIVPVLIAAVMIPGSTDRFISFMLDISEQEQLRALNTAKDEFISIASHQLRTPATGVKQYLGMLLEGYVGELNEDQRTILQTAYDGNERQLTIVNDLLRVAQADASEVILNTAPVDIVTIMQDVIDEQLPRFRSSQQSIAFNSQKPEIIAMVDPLQIRMVFENLLDNAHKYMPPKKSVLINIKQYSDSIRISIKDQGVGIYKKDMPKLFKKFSRIENPLSTVAGGTGLGLYWVNKIIELHDGKITVASQYKKGTEFVITLPTGINKARKGSKS